jgi:predicted ATPase
MMQGYDDNRKQAIAVVESLRAGIPTRASTRELPELRASLTKLIEQDLEQLAQGTTPKGRLIWGAYGQGKTHTH